MPASWLDLAAGEGGPLLMAYLAEQLAQASGRPVAELDPSEPLTSLGLDSLSAAHLQHAVERDLGVVVQVAEILAGPTLHELAGSLLERLAGGSGTAESDAAEVALLPLARPSGGFPLSYGQRALWFLQRLAPANAAYHIAAAAEVCPALDPAVLRRALDLLAGRHEALHLAFDETPAGPRQRVLPGRTSDFAAVDATRWSAAELAEHLHSAAYRPFDLERDPLLRVEVFRTGPDTQTVLLVAHHIIADLWSLAILVRDLGAFYAQLLEGEEPAAGAPALHFADYVLLAAAPARERDRRGALGLLARANRRGADGPGASPPITRARRCKAFGAARDRSGSRGSFSTG